MNKGTCSREGCPGGGRIVLGLCTKHYREQLEAERRAAKQWCSKDGCEEPYRSKGLCAKHYMEERAERLKGEKCRNPECDNPRGNTDGYCPACYHRSLTYGDPNAGPPRRRKRRAESPRTGTRSEYHVNHAMVRKERGPAWDYDCEHCDQRAQTWAQIHETTGDSPDHYMALCWSCHAKYDDFAKRLPDNIGSKRSAETRELLRQRQLERWERPGEREKMSVIATKREARKREAREAAGDGRLF